MLVAWGARAVLAAALEPRRPWLAVHHDLLPAAASARSCEAATRRADGVAAASRGDRATQLGGDVASCTPASTSTRFTPAPLPAGPPQALVLGALVGWKRPELALEIAARMPELRVTFAGAPLPGDDAARRCASRRRPRHARRPRRRRPRRRSAEHHVLLHCADAEPYGLALVEALAAGRPVVAPAAAGPLEIVQDGAGRLYPPGDADAAAAALRAVSPTPRRPQPRAAAPRQAFDVRDSRRRAASDRASHARA